MYPEADGELANFICNLRLQAPYESLYPTEIDLTCRAAFSSSIRTNALV
jgi:hypothetical protein